MSAQVETASPPTLESRGVFARVVSFFESLVGLVLVGLVVAGIVSLTLTWRTTDVEFISGGELEITQWTWWGFDKEVTHYYASGPDGWAIKSESGKERVPLRSQPVRLRN